MSPKPLVERRLARRDIEDAIDFYAAEAGEAVALEFVDALEATYRLIADHPAAGSTRYAFELNLPDLRSRRVRGFPYIVFYVERADDIDIWRVLHGHRDIPEWLQEPDPS
jgi:toxin ParE1/3/4